MTTYTITAEQREQLLDAFDSVAGKGKRCDAAEKLLQSLQPNTQEPVGKIEHLDELNERWTQHLPIGTKLYTHPAPQQTQDAQRHNDYMAGFNEGWDRAEKQFKPAPQAKPLTDEQIIEIAQSTQSAEPGRDGYILPISFARAIEAAHNIGVKP